MSTVSLDPRNMNRLNKAPLKLTLLICCMKHVPFGQTGALVSPLGIGSLSVDLGMERLEYLVNRLLDAGCNLIDTAAIYDLGQHESFLGERLSHRRDDYLLITKCGHHDLLPDGSLVSRPISMADIESACQRLKTDRLDAMLLHSYDMAPLQQGEAIQVLQTAQEQGKIRWWGYSGDNEWAEWAVQEAGAQILECSFNLADQHNLSHGIAAARDMGTGVIAKKAIANAMWAFFDRPEEAHPANRAYIPRLQAMELRPEEYGCRTLAELALRFTIAHVDTAIASTRSEERQEANLAAAAKGPLSEDTCLRIRECFTKAEGESEDSPWLGCN